MKVTRRFAVASLLVLAAAVVLGTTAPASAGKVKGTQVTLYPTADSPSPHATGTVTLYWPDNTGLYYAEGVVSVSKLAPNALYYMPVKVLASSGWTTFRNVRIRTDAHGKGESGLGAQGDSIAAHQSFQVYDASGTLVLTSNP